MNTTPRVEYGEFKNPGNRMLCSKISTLCIGDYISLFCEDIPGFLCADGFTDEKVYIQVLIIDFRLVELPQGDI